MARVLLECAALESLDVRLVLHPLACSWRSLSMRNSTAAALRSLYIRENVTRARAIGRHCSWFALSFCVSFETRSVSALGSVLFCFLLCLLWFRLDIAPFSSLLRLLSSLLFLCLWSLTVSPTLLTSAPRPSTCSSIHKQLSRNFWK